MKKQLLTLVACAVVAASTSTISAQSKKLQVSLKNGNTVEYALDEVDHLSFASEQTNPPADEKTAYAFTIPTDFSTGRVQKVMAAGKQVAEIAYEYVLASDAVLTVVYPMTEDGTKADLTKGINAADGGSVVWDSSTNKATVTAGTEALSQLYVVDGELSTSLPDGYTTADATVTPYLLVDARGTESNSYTIVKVATQYWTGENLRATKYLDGSDIKCYTASQASDFTNAEDGAYHIYADNNDVLSTYGCLYNAYAFAGIQDFIPEGWDVPTQAQWVSLRTAVNRKPAYLKSSDESYWGEGYAGTNLSGFNALPAGYFANGDYDDNEADWWSSTSYYDAYSKANNWDYARITYKGTSVVVSSSTLGGRVGYFGMSIRLIRK